ncbi:nitrilase-related carbon-nitrogen hydrolase [Glycomyces sp. NPDC048151]|uniref:nitrilase-related carbon-nitrogen hydrolase n=1 Tax=Glycomyces sp. NPDC048151 TaxID=3364002 RepID=UPI0037210138
MASSPRHPVPLAIAAAAATALLYAFGFALDPVPWLMWIAPVPLLLAVPRLGFWAALLTAELAWLGGTARIWNYLAQSLEMPPVFVIVSALMFTGMYTAATLLYRALIRRGRHWTAFLAMPAAVVAVEYVGSVVNAEAGGEWWSFAYTQADQTAVLQLVSVTGIWGLTFLLLAVPTALATLLAPGVERKGRIGIAAVAATCLAATVAFGLARPADQGDTIRAAALALPTDEDSIRIGTDKAERLFADYEAEITRLGQADDIDVLVLPEKTFHVTAEESGPYLDRWSALAAESGIDLVLGLALDHGDDTFNAAVWVPADGSAMGEYHKQHLVTGLEDWMTASEAGPTFVGEQRWALTVCKDLDHTATIAEYGDGGAGLVLAPALDFTVDGWWHSRVAVTRGVEQGFSLVRAGQIGLMTVSDASGHVLAEDERLAVADVPAGNVETVYGRFGNWFLFPAFAMLLAGIAAAIPARRRQDTAVEADEPALASR